MLKKMSPQNLIVQQLIKDMANRPDDFTIKGDYMYDVATGFIWDISVFLFGYPHLRQPYIMYFSVFDRLSIIKYVNRLKAVKMLNKSAQFEAGNNINTTETKGENCGNN